jgi:hypothetical protein
MSTPRISGLFFLALGLGLGLISGCRVEETVVCSYKKNEAFDPKSGTCYPCPEGTKVNVKTAKCQKIPETPDAIADGGSAELPDLRPGDLPEAGPETDLRADLPTDGGGGPDHVIPKGQIGSSCNKDADCLDGGACFDWPEGYCIKPNCSQNEDCPEGSACLPLIENGSACFDACAADPECRPGYGCKSIPQAQGLPQSACHPVAAPGKPLGAQCVNHTECAGKLACIVLGSASMCAWMGCGLDAPCEEGAACVVWGSLTICLPRCQENAECAVLASEQFTCQGMEDADGAAVNVCSPTKQGLSIGQLCYYSTECETGYCGLLVFGRCSGMDNHECGSDGDCAEGLCIADPSVQKGVCSKPCGPGDACPSGSFCIAGSKDGPTCMAVCDNFGQQCGPPDLGMACTYGTLFYPVAPSGKYACVKIPAGASGTPCQTDGDCAKGFCYGAQSHPGYCAAECQSNNDCPFGTNCQQDSLVAGKLHCARICYADLDCATGFACKNTLGSEKACLLP